MAELSAVAAPAPLPKYGVIRERLGRAKREAVDLAMEKGESWSTKVLNGEQGVKLDDIARLLDALGLKAVDKRKVCVDGEIAHAYEAIARKAAVERSLLFDDAE